MVKVRNWLLVVLALPAAGYPLDGLSADEYKRVKTILLSSGKLTDAARFHSVALDEPEKARVRAWKPGAVLPRRALAMVSERGASYEAVVDLSSGGVVSFE